MDKVLNNEVKDIVICKSAKPITNGVLVSQNFEDQSDLNGEDDNESTSLLPKRKGGISRKSNSIKRNVQWNDNNGNKLTEVLVYEPSEVSDSDDEESDACMCIVM
ncbi:hypothetical protein ACFE04_014182 [Oxalis oulophora]